MEAKYSGKNKRANDSDDDDDEDDDDGEIEDENGELNDPKEWEDDFLRVLPLLKSKGSALYDKDIKFFEPEAQEAHLNEQERLKKAFTDAASRTTGGDDDDDLVQLKPKTAEELKAEEEHYGEWLKKHQEMTKKMDASLAEATSASADKSSSKGSKKAATKSSSSSSSALPDIGGSAGDEILLRFWKEDANLTEDEKFLRKYIWDKMWIDNGEGNGSDNDDDNDDDDNKNGGDEFDDEQDRFEHRYNFRYEEPGGADIAQYPRVIEGSQRVNKKAEKRAAKRKERKERKQLEKLEKAQEIARMKALQKELINEKLDMVKKTAGLARSKEEDELLSSLNFDDDFDPKKWDEKLASIFNDDYYAEAEDKKPVFEHDDFIDNNDQLDKSSASALLNPLHADASDVNGVDYDADAVPDDEDDDDDDEDIVMDDNNEESDENGGDDDKENSDDEKMKDDDEEEGGESESNPVLDKALETDTIFVGKHLKKKQKKQMLQKQEQQEGEGEGEEQQEEKTVTPEEAQKAAREAKAMIEKYYNLDFEDIIGDMPCRFKYTNVEPDHSGLTVEDVLCADDETLAQVVPIKKIATYIPKGEQITNRPIRGLMRRIYGRQARRGAPGMKRRQQQQQQQGGKFKGQKKAFGKKDSKKTTKGKKAVKKGEGETVEENTNEVVVVEEEKKTETEEKNDVEMTEKKEEKKEKKDKKKKKEKKGKKENKDVEKKKKKEEEDDDGGEKKEGEEN